MVSFYQPTLIVIFFITLITTLIEAEDEVPCDFYLAPSTVPGAGRAIFAGKALDVDDLLEESITISLTRSSSMFWILDNYIYSCFSASGEERAKVIFGAAMLFNHMDDSNMHHAWRDNIGYCESETISSHSTGSQVGFHAKREVFAGDELFASYGGDHWFTERGIPLFKKADDVEHHVSSDYLKSNGICLSHVFLGRSRIPMAGNGIFAKKRFLKGELIYVSPVLMLPKKELISAAEDSVLFNYCIVSKDKEIDVALLPIGLTAIANHQSKANMEYKWYDRGEDLAYYATRDIEANEELTINYGDKWIDAWTTYMALSETSGNHSFRFNIEAYHSFPIISTPRQCLNI